MQTATATVAGRRRVSFTLPEPAATTFIPRDVESPSRDDAARRSTWPPTRTERYPEGLRKARAPTRSESEPGPTKTCLLDVFADESRAVDADAYEELRLGDDFFDYTAWLFFACAITLRCIFHEHETGRLFKRAWLASSMCGTAAAFELDLRGRLRRQAPSSATTFAIS